MGFTKSTTARHASRTTQSDAAFLLPYIQPHHHILDIGCGPGTITAGFLELVPHGSVTGIDLSSTVLQQAQETTQALIARSPETQRGKITYQEGDVVVGPSLQDDAFDVVFASQVLVHLPGQNTAVRALKEIRRVVKAGGIPEYNLEELWGQNALKGIGIDEWPGPKMKGHYRQAGFDVDVGSNVYAGTIDERKTFARSYTGRFNPGEQCRESWIKAGVSDEEIRDPVQTLEKWADTQDAWATHIQSELLAWK
ncbi:S-adenosyl-L-methionine-dependent methyltransferase [Viridothelium virens]|uniref:S-adenosyl-L-methionine-dependent methyltransferase n=1 Tax=Viridothelium virens TaxID=1048519 RepID=A0A6A6GSC2_VIRVR|nr:S-adenosyl-L-methionine-dependent methyltransferase [Viridothelium virens]